MNLSSTRPPYSSSELGAFENMIIKEDWGAIRCTVKIKNLDTGDEILQSTMEFVHFKDNGDKTGARHRRLDALGCPDLVNRRLSTGHASCKTS